MPPTGCFVRRDQDRVTGSYDHKAKLLTATKIVVNDKPVVRPDDAEGKIASISSPNFVLTVKEASFKPTGATITVATTATTVISKDGKAITFADLTMGARMKIIGTFDATTQTLTATKIKIEIEE